MFNPVQFYEFGKKRISTPTFNLSTSIFAAYNLDNGIDSKSGYNAVVGNAITFSTGVNGNGANFSPVVDSQMVINSNQEFGFTNGNRDDKPFSISFFIKLASIGRNSFIVCKRDNTPTGDSWQIAVASDNILSFIIYSEQNTINLSVKRDTAFLNNTKYHVTVSYDGSKTISGMKIYINGVLVNVTNNSAGNYYGMPSTNIPISLGRLATNSNNIYRLDGQLDELYFFNGVIDQNSVNFLQSNYFPF
jgi:hypothetical protein